MLETIAAGVFGVLAAVAVLFQLALAAGAPWGEMTLGGKYSGRLPAAMRVAALVQAMVLLGLAWGVLARASLFVEWPSLLPDQAIWFVVAFCALSLTLNTITPSKKERRLWAPVLLVMLVCSLIVAL
ncbi:MAG: hypothetical protein ACX931_03880 [Saccharospirillum sp.]